MQHVSRRGRQIAANKELIHHKHPRGIGSFLQFPGAGVIARQGFLRPEQFAALRDAMPENLRPLLTFLYTAGCRIGAARKIVWEWVDLGEGVVEIPEGVVKNDDPIALPLDPELLAMLGKLFRREGKPVFDATNFRKEFEKAAVACGLGTLSKAVSPKGHPYTKYEGLIPQDLRRSAVRNMKRAGVQDSVAMAISGHKADHIFRRYNITDLDDKRAAARKVAAYNAKRRNNASSMQLAPRKTRPGNVVNSVLSTAQGP